MNPAARWSVTPPGSKAGGKLLEEAWRDPAPHHPGGRDTHLGAGVSQLLALHLDLLGCRQFRASSTQAPDGPALPSQPPRVTAPADGWLFAGGRSQAEVARILGVARQNVSRWHARWHAGGLPALASRGPTGTAPRLSDQQLHDLEQALRQGARAHGFDTDHWTLARIATVIERLTGTRYHPGHVWKGLRRRMGWRPQRPARRAVERDEQAIARWVAEDWP